MQSSGSSKRTDPISNACSSPATGFPTMRAPLPRAVRPGAQGGALRFVGRVGGGFTDSVRERLNALLREHPRSSPLVPCPEKGRWIEPGLYCTVSFTELTSQGLLRSPVFEALIEA